MNDALRFWGVRGSTPAPGLATAVAGGNTSCVEVRLGGERIIVDGGTGLRAFGAAEAGRPMVITILFSHLHWDHIQGVPFFAPLFHPSSRVTMIGPRGLERALAAQMSMPSFPVGMDAFGATIEFIEIEPGDRFSIGEVEVETAALCHPGGAIGYRLAWGTRSVVHLSDHEPTAAAAAGSGVLDLARDATVLVCDAQYTPEELPARRGWGHGTFEQAAELAWRAGAVELCLTHHDPTRTDAELVLLERRAALLFDRVSVAREGDVVVLSPGPPPRLGAASSPFSGSAEKR
jgi:phosphoribosyl 1,2-cyclic phosphodiesterase